MLERVKSWLPGIPKRHTGPKTSVSGAELIQWISEGRRLVILDIREQKAFRQGHIKGSTLIPSFELNQRLHELRGGQPIVVVGKTSGRSQQAARLLRTHGHDAIYLVGGFSAWPGKTVR